MDTLFETISNEFAAMTMGEIRLHTMAKVARKSDRREYEEMASGLGREALILLSARYLSYQALNELRRQVVDAVSETRIKSGSSTWPTTYAEVPTASGLGRK